MQDQVKLKFETALNSVALTTLYLMALDTSLLGGYRLFSIGPFSYRLILLIVGLGCTTVKFAYDNKKTLIRSSFILAFLMFAIIMAVGMVRAIVYGQSMELAMLVVKNYIYLAFLPIMLYCITSHRRLEVIMKITIICATLVSLMALALQILLSGNEELLNYLHSFLDSKYLALVIGVSDKISRVMPHGPMSLIFSCGFSIYLYLKEEKNRWYYAVSTGIVLSCILLTFTRSIYLGVFLAAIMIFTLVFFIDPDKRKRLLRFTAIVVATFAVLIASLSMYVGTNYISYALYRVSIGTPLENTLFKLTTGISVDEYLQELPNPGKDESKQNSILKNNREMMVADSQANTLGMSIRAQMLELEKELIAKNPLFGNGLGAAIDLRDGRVELVYHDLLSKLGIIGVVMLFSPAIIAIFKFVMPLIKKRKRTEAFFLQTVCLSCLLGMLLATYYNPYFPGPQGMFFYCLTIRVFMNDKFEIRGD